MTCKQCGGENRSDDRFCRTCGCALDTPAPPPEVPAETAPEVPAETAPEVPAEAEDALVYVTFDDSLVSPSPAAPHPPAGAAGVLTADSPALEEADAAPADEGDPVPAPPSGRGSVGLWLASSALLFVTLGAAALSLALLLANCAPTLITLAATLLAPLLPLQLTVAAASLPVTVGLILLVLAVFCQLLRSGGRPALALRCLGGAAAVSGGALILTGLFFEAWQLLPLDVTAALAGNETLRGNCFIIGFVLLVTGLLVFIATLPVRRRTPPQRGIFYRGAFQFLATLSLTAAAIALTMGVFFALQGAVPADAPPKYLLTEAQSAFAAGNYRAALDLIGPDAAIGAGNAEDCLLAARSRRALGDREGARSTLRAALTAHPNDAALCAELAEILIQLGDEAAVHAYADRAKAAEAAVYYREALLYAPGSISAKLAAEALDAFQ